MLNELGVKNLVVIKEAALEFSPGFNVITGETGAGKTMLTQAIRLISGEKADSSLVGPNGDESYVEASFSDKAPLSLEDLVGQEELVLARRLRREQPARAFVSGRSCAADQLKAASQDLISLTGQHAARKLADPRYQLALIDQAGGLDKEVETVTKAYRAWKAKAKELRTLQETLADGKQKVELLRHELALIEELEPFEGEVESLEIEREKLLHIDSLREAALTAKTLVLDDDGVSDSLGVIVAKLEKVFENDPELGNVYQEFVAGYEQIIEAARVAGNLADAYEADNSRLEEVESRLVALNDLVRRFSGLPIQAILERAEQYRIELSQIDNGEELLDDLMKQTLATEKDYNQKAKNLSSKRRASGKKFSQKVETHLHDLALEKAKFIVSFKDVSATLIGTDEAAFQLQANPGMPATELDKGASGGELARVNLALLLALEKSAGCFVFDEVDAGIGGETAHVVASKLKDLSKHSQVIVVTHLAQLAVKADRHFFVQKNEATSVKQLDELERDFEIARLIGARASNQQEARAARELLENR